MADVKTTGNVVEFVSSKFQWRIKKFSDITDKILYSDIFNVGVSKWRLVVYPKGDQGDDYLSIYLAVADSAKLPSGWSRKAKFSLAVINQSNSTSTVRNEGTQTQEFKAEATSWGYRSFVPLRKIRDPKENFLVDDTLIIEVELTVSDVMHPSVSVERKKPEQQSIQAPPSPPPPPPVIAKEKELPKDPSVEPKEYSQDVLTKSKNLLTELSSRTTTQRSSSTDNISVSPQPDNLQQKNEALPGFFNMSLEAIQQANAFGNIEKIIRTLIPNTNDLQKKTVLEDLASRLKEFQEIIPTAKAAVEAAENLEAEVVVRNVEHYSVPDLEKEDSTVESEIPEQVIQAPKNEVPASEKQNQDEVLPAASSTCDQEVDALSSDMAASSQHVTPYSNLQIKSQNLLPELSSQNRTSRPFLSGAIAVSREAAGPESRESIPISTTIEEAAQARKTSLSEKATDLDARLSHKKKTLSSLDAEFSRLLDEEEKLEAEIRRLITQKEELLVHKKSVAGQLEKVNQETAEDLEELQSLKEEMKQANTEWLGAKEKLELVNVHWKLLKGNLKKKV
ncbi:hypothetical protein JCGZ_23891 [Jatropha curcas]|uniref:MATH domain-containing protein n=1 Tax=Jatropha curcas TaxID=180498 RepID=A0A067LFR2_JATCU|nr:hypothetical protein JCGZ_23891 [Jatropha curcas]